MGILTLHTTVQNVTQIFANAMKQGYSVFAYSGLTFHTFVQNVTANLYKKYESVCTEFAYRISIFFQRLPY